MFKNIAHGFKVLIVIAFSLSLFSNQIISVNAEENLAESISEREQEIIVENLVKEIKILSGTVVEVADLEVLRDVEGQNSYILAVFKGTGYAILTRVNGVIVIFDLESNNIPYDNTPEEATNIFGGPFNYYVDLGNGQMEDLDSQEIVDIETVSTEIIETNQRMINSESIQSASNSLRVLSTRGAVTGIDSSRFARYNSGKWINSTSNYPASAGYPYKDHWVTAYRYQDNGSATSYYWAVDNRGSYTAVINVGWTAGVVGMFR